MKYRVLVSSIYLLTTVSVAQEVMPVQRPEVKVGETWTYVVLDWYTKQTKAEWTFEVVGVDDSYIKTELRRYGNNSTRTYGRDWSPSGGFQQLSFPLEVGKKWKSQYSYNDPNCGRVTDDLEAEVKGWEDIEVPAGKFRALRIEHNGFYTGPLPGCGAGRKNRWFWYVPSIKRYVRAEERAYTPQGQLGFGEVFELKAFKVQ